MKFEPKNVQHSINKAFLKEPVERKKFNAFKDALGNLINKIGRLVYELSEDEIGIVEGSI